MSKTKDTMWNRLIKRVLPKWWHTAPPVNEERNENTLSRLEENDPVLTCVREHAFAQFSNELETALDRNAPVAVRISAADSASGLRRFLEDMEYKRQGWNEYRIEQLRQAEARAAKERQAAAGHDGENRK